MNDTLTYRRLGEGLGGPEGLSPWPWNPNDTVETPGMKPVGRKDFEASGIVSGVWACNAGSVRIGGHPVNEVCFVLRGSVTVADENGRSETFRAGEGFLLPRGVQGSVVQLG